MSTNEEVNLNYIMDSISSMKESFQEGAREFKEESCQKCRARALKEHTLGRQVWHDPRTNRWRSKIQKPKSSRKKQSTC